ncbi:hypothetical protein QBC45DRAFT_81154 [Copromyces sp. CBS 386.78]|nr:hypothetical protein QBC45DRAFT_81154 [Copromyces sp. CBS 386.78]
MELKRKADSVSTSSDSSSPTNSPQPSLPSLQLPCTSTGLDSTASPPKKIKIIIKPRVEVEESPILGHGVQPNFANVDWVGPGGTGAGVGGAMGVVGCGGRPGLEEVSPKSMTFCGSR